MRVDDRTGRAWQVKVDHRLLALVERARGDAREAARRVHVLVRFRGAVERLRERGLDLGTAAGDVAAASLALADVPRVAGAPEVVFIELSRPLGPPAPTERERLDSPPGPP